MKQKMFSVAQANRTLPLVRRIVDDLMARYREYHERQQELERLRARAPRAERAADLEDEIHGLSGKINEHIAELERIGCQPKDLDKGLVDFFTEMNGEIACLCWMQGEDRIRYWHSLEDGFGGRQLLPSEVETRPLPNPL